MGLGRLHTLSSLAFHVLPAWGDGGSGGSTVTVRPTNGAPMEVPRGDRTYAAPISQPHVLDANLNAKVVGRGECAVDARAFNSEASLEWKPALHGAKAVCNEPLVREDDNGAGIFHEAEAVRLLTLLRNMVSGGVFRVMAEYDVVGIPRRGLGVCAEGSCTTMYAVDTTSFNIFSTDPHWLSNLTSVPVVTLARTDGAPPQVVPIDDEAVLSLGRAVLSQPRGSRSTPGGWSGCPATPPFGCTHSACQTQCRPAWPTWTGTSGGGR